MILLLWNLWNSPRSYIISPLGFCFLISSLESLKPAPPYASDFSILLIHFVCPDKKSSLLFIMLVGISLAFFIQCFLKFQIFTTLTLCHSIYNFTYIIVFHFTWVWSAFQDRMSCMFTVHLFVHIRGTGPWDVRAGCLASASCFMVEETEAQWRLMSYSRYFSELVVESRL